MASRVRALDPCARRITFRMQTQDMRSYMVTDAVRRARRAAARAGGEYVRTLTPPKRIKRWCVLRSPHVNKTSREHFWMHTHTRVLQWDAGANVDRAAPIVIARNLPTVAIRVQDNMPGLMALPVVWEMLNPPAVAQDAPDGTTTAAIAADAVNAEVPAPDAVVEEAIEAVPNAEEAVPDADPSTPDAER